MIESSMAVILLGIAAYCFVQQRQETRLAHLGWIIGATRMNRDHFDSQKLVEEADRLGQIADSLSKGTGCVALKITMDESVKTEVRQAAVVAAQHDYLVRISLIEGARNYAAAKDALSWLSRKAGG